MRLKLALAMLALFAFSPVIFAHDLFLKPDKFRLLPKQKLSIQVLNGYFNKSEGAVNFQRLSQATMVSSAGAMSPLAESVFAYGKDMTRINMIPTESGTHVVGISTKTRDIFLLGKDFNEYLDHDGIPDVLAARKRDNEMEKAANEIYSKHVKTIFQVGGKLTDAYKTSLGFPVEIIPVKNPFALRAGASFEFLCLKDGKPLANQYVMSGREFGGKMFTGANVRTDEKGIARVKLSGPGKWYVKFIEMVKMGQPNVDYESKWATLTFEIR